MKALMLICAAMNPIYLACAFLSSCSKAFGDFYHDFGIEKYVTANFTRSSDLRIDFNLEPRMVTLSNVIAQCRTTKIPGESHHKSQKTSTSRQPPRTSPASMEATSELPIGTEKG